MGGGRAPTGREGKEGLTPLPVLGGVDPEPGPRSQMTVSDGREQGFPPPQP